MADETNELWKIIKSGPVVIKWGLVLYLLLCIACAICLPSVSCPVNIALVVFGTISGLFIVFFIISLIVVYYKKKAFLESKQITAYCFGQDDIARDRQFDKSYEIVKHTYWVLGSSLKSMEDRESLLETMCAKGVKIKLCMMNPKTAMKNICFESARCNVCGVQQLLINGELIVDNLNVENISEVLEKCSSFNNILDQDNVIINEQHLQKYYGTNASYKDRVEESYHHLCNIQDAMKIKYGEEAFEVLLLDSFIPMTMTIVDAEYDDGFMIVDFHLPFTSNKVLVEFSKKINKDNFNNALQSYKQIYQRAKLHNSKRSVNSTT